MAEKYLNDHGGVLGRPVKVVIEDDQSKLEVATQAAEKMVTQDKAVALAGFYKSFITKGVFESVSKKYNIVTFTAGWLDDLTANHDKLMFRAGPFIGAQTDQWVAFLEYVAQKTGHNKLAAYSENTDYGTSFQDQIVAALKAHGKVQVVADLHHDYQATDFTTDLTKIKQTGANLFWSATVSSNVMTMIKQAYDVGLSHQAIMTTVADGFYYTDEYAKTVGNKGDNVIITSFHKPGIQYTNFTSTMDQLYKEMGYGTNVDYYITIQEFQDVLLIAQAIKTAGSTDTNAMVQALESMTFNGPWGVIKFSMEATGPYYHQWTPPMLFEQYQNLNLKVVYPESVAEAPMILPSG